MTKKATISILIVFSLILLMSLLKLFRLPILSVHPHEAIPPHTALFFSLNKSELEKMVVKRPLLSDLFLPKNLPGDFSLFLEIVGEQLALPDDQPFFISVNPSKSLGSDLLFIMPKGRGAKLAEFGKKAGWKPQGFIFDGQQVLTFRKGDQAFSFTKYRNLLIFAKHAYLVENAVSQLKKPNHSLCRDKSFKSLYRHFDFDEPGSFPLFVNLESFSAQFAPMLNANKFSQLKNIGQIGQWQHWQIPLDGQINQWKGTFIPAKDNLLTAASIAAKSKLEDYLFQAVPDNLSAFIALNANGLSEPLSSPEWEKYLSSWVGPSIVLAIGELLQKDQYEQFLLLPAKDGKGAEKALEEWSNGQASDYQVFKIWPIKTTIFENLAGTEVRFATVLGDFVLFGNNLPGMERWLGKYLAGQTFSNAPDFLKMKTGLPAANDGLLYLDGLKGWQLIAPFLNEQVYLSITRNPLPFAAVLAALNWDGRVGELDFIVPQNKVETAGEANILWSVPLRANAARRPFASADPRTKEVDVLVVDEENRLYLISRNGRVIWQRELSEPILSDIFHIQINNDHQGQFAFSTRSHIYVVDRRGEDLDGFPLELQVPASNGVTVVDFFQSNDYQFFIVCENGKAYGFDEKGSPVEGWRPNEGVGEVRKPMLHFQAEGKDFLALLDENGKMQVYKKNGAYRFNRVNFDQSELQPLDYQVSKKSSRIVTADPNGKVYVTNLAGDHFGLQLKAGDNKDFHFLFSDVVGDERKDYIALSGQDLTVSYYKDNGFIRAFEYRFPWPQDNVFSVKWERRTKDFIGTLNRSKKQLFLMDGHGKVPDQFPLAGSTPFVLVDLAGDGKPVIVTGNGAAATAYVLE